MIWTIRHSEAFRDLVNDIHHRLAAKRQTQAMQALANAVIRARSSEDMPADRALVSLPFLRMADRERPYAGETLALAGLESPSADDSLRAKLAIHVARLRIGRGDLAGACALLDLDVAAMYRSAVAWGIAKALIASGNLERAAVPLARLCQRDQDSVWRQAFLARPDPWAAASLALLGPVSDGEIRLDALRRADDRHFEETSRRHPALHRRRRVEEAAARGLRVA